VHLKAEDVYRRISQVERRIEGMHVRLAQLHPGQADEARYARTVLSVLERSLDLLYKERYRLVLSRRDQLSRKWRLQPNDPGVGSYRNQ
jgi:hypothetical protein